jgi:hypothetical protein
MDERDDQLRERLARIDPMSPAVPTDPPASAYAQDLRETIMQTAPDHPTADEQPAHRRRPVVWITAAAVIAALAWGAYALTNDSSEDSAAVNEIDLAVAPSDPMAICLTVDAEVLAPADHAFAGTVLDVTDTAVTLEVDHWYKGGDDITNAVLSIAEGNDVALDGVAFTEGERYLVSSTNGTVNGCGLSGEATPEFEALYAEAFG